MVKSTRVVAVLVDKKTDKSSNRAVTKKSKLKQRFEI